MKETKVYKKTEDCSIRMDIYYQVPGAPIILYFHGGGLIFGTRREFTEDQAMFFKEAGYNVVSIDYRLAPETKLTEIVEDVSDSVEWIKKKSREWYDMDTDRLIFMGRSAGAYLSLLLAARLEEKPKAVISLYGYGDILGDWYRVPSPFYLQKKRVDYLTARKMVGKYGTTDGSSERFLFYLHCRQEGTWLSHVTGLNLQLDSDALKRLNPLDLVTPDFPPAFLIHGDQDTDVPYEESVKMMEKINQANGRAKLLTMQNRDHGFDLPFEREEGRYVFNRIIDFLSTVLPKRQ